MCVNPLSIGTPISTLLEETDDEDSENVSIPYLSGHPFLRWVTKKQGGKYYCVNPLSIGTPISTAATGSLKLDRDVSIPYLSGHPFLPL